MTMWVSRLGPVENAAPHDGIASNGIDAELLKVGAGGTARCRQNLPLTQWRQSSQ